MRSVKYVLSDLYFFVFFFLMIRRPPRSTRTDTLFPYTTLFRSPKDEYDANWDWSGAVEDLQLYYAIGRELAAGNQWPNWYPAAEFRAARARSEEHTSELQSLMRISYAVFCLKKKNK